ncbi:hypothetical protein N431DRAFT_444978 [Stipitochalara longipes BDJ]|nr:hypothetical protein N431DRAFT_444978 [Stipitochalara longipes BDJ]
MALARFACTIENCPLNFDSEGELHRHEEEFHGELRRHLQASGGSSGVSSSEEAGLPAVKQQEENGVSNANSEVRTPSSAEYRQEHVIMNQGPRQHNNNISTSNINLKPQTAASTPAGRIAPIGHHQKLQTAFAKPPIIEYSPLPKGSIPRIFEGTQFGGNQGTSLV